MPAASHSADRRRSPEPLPLTILTGFLGAGKTTLLNRLLKDEALSQTAVIINEFGDVALDHLLVEYIGDNMVLLQSGCLCCTMRGDLVDARWRPCCAISIIGAARSAACCWRPPASPIRRRYCTPPWRIPIWCCATGSTAC